MLFRSEKALATPPRGDRPSGFGNAVSKALMETRYLVDRGDWQGAAAMTMNPTGVPIADSLYRFTRGLGMLRSRLAKEAGGRKTQKRAA